MIKKLATTATKIKNALAISDTRMHSDKGATAVEYGLIIGLIAVVIIVAVTLLGNNIAALFNSVATQIAPKP